MLQPHMKGCLHTDFDFEHICVCVLLVQAQQLSEKAQKLDDRDAVLQRGLQVLESETAQLATAQLAVQSAVATNKQLSADLAEERDSLAKQSKSLIAREAELQTNVQRCDRSLQVSRMSAINADL